MLYHFKRFIALALIISGLGIGYLTYWLYQPILLPQTAQINVLSGSSAKLVAQALVEQGILDEPHAFSWWLRFTRKDRAIKAGIYIFPEHTTRHDVITQLLQGSRTLMRWTLIAGTTFADLRQQLTTQPAITPVVASMSETQIADNLKTLQKLEGWNNNNVEGLFAADTYFYATGTSDLQLLRIAYRLQMQRIADAWKLRKATLPLQTPYELLTLASIVEKETGHEADRTKIAGVFVNRLQLRMRLQSDPTTIYGMAQNFNGNLRRIDLETDTAYNTYTRNGLTPTPICVVSKAALRATVQPATTNALYFVAKGNGHSYFSATLEEHNQAVNRYQRSPRKQ